jgi:tetratricopeptide (TPR) repeat protein
LQNAVAVIKDNFLLGVGFCNYSTVSQSYAKVYGFDISQADNIFLQLFAETGIAGLLLFLAVIAVFFIFIVKKLCDKDSKVIYLPVMLAVIFFIAYNLFESAAFISTNMLIFFMLLAFPFDIPEIKNRTKRINSYISIILLLPLLYVLALPLLAAEDYKRGLVLFTANKYVAAADCYLSAIKRDGINPAYASKLSDTYFAMSRKAAESVNLDKAIEYKKFASSLNGRSGKYYYDLAWLYKYKGEKRLACDNITKAVEADPFDEHILNAYGELIY